MLICIPNRKIFIKTSKFYPNISTVNSVTLLAFDLFLFATSIIYWLKYKIMNPEIKKRRHPPSHPLFAKAEGNVNTPIPIKPFIILTVALHKSAVSSFPLFLYSSLSIESLLLFSSSSSLYLYSTFYFFYLIDYLFYFDSSSPLMSFQYLDDININ